MECSYDGCERPARGGNTICKHHQLVEWRARQGPCSIEGCERRANAARLCEMHYKRRQRGLADWDKLIAPRMKRGDACAVDGCDRAVYARDHCQLHLQRIDRLGAAGPPGLLKAARGEGGYDGRGYRVITVDGQRHYEHRWVMEQMIGRPLEPDEEVHHRNRVRDDNDPSNLELWCTPQPRGGRVEDLVAFYVGRYPELAAQVLRSLRKGGQ